MGRWHDALGLAQEAVRLYRDLPPGNPAFTPNLAGALANLSTKYTEVGGARMRWAPRRRLSGCTAG